MQKFNEGEPTDKQEPPAHFVRHPLKGVFIGSPHLGDLGGRAILGAIKNMQYPPGIALDKIEKYYYFVKYRNRGIKGVFHE